MDALLRRPSREVPFFETEFSPGVAAAILGRSVSCRTYQLPPADYIELLDRTGIDMAYLVEGWRPGALQRKDADGRVQYAGGTIRTREELRRVQPASLDPIKQRIESFLEVSSGTNIGWVFALNSESAVCASMGYEEYYLALCEDPEFVEEFMDRYEEYTLPQTELVLQYKPDAVVMAVNTCGKTGLTMSPEHVERFVYSRLRKQTAPILSQGVPIILHSDGDNREVMEDWIAMGFAALHPVEPTGSFDIYEAKARWGGQIALLGNIDLAGVLTKGSPEDVAKDTIEHLERLSEGGGYICGSSHDIDDNVPIENLRAMMETVHGWKRNPSG